MRPRYKPLEGNMHVPDKQKHTHTVEAEKGKKKKAGRREGKKRKKLHTK